MQKDYRLTQILPGITLLDGFAHECSIYLVAGERRAALIDTGMGTGNLAAAAEKAAPGRELLVFNTHCHFDHCTGNSQFPEVHVHPDCYADLDEAAHDGHPREVELSGLPHYDCRRVPVREGDRFDLGGRTLEVVETPGHTPGDICLLDRADRVLFAGDLIGTDGHCIHMLHHIGDYVFSTVSIETYRRSLLKVAALGGSYDCILAGHDAVPLGRDLLDEVIRMTGDILDGSAKPFHPQLAPEYGDTVCWRLDGKDTAILYQDEVLRDK